MSLWSSTLAVASKKFVEQFVEHCAQFFDCDSSPLPSLTTVCVYTRVPALETIAKRYSMSEPMQTDIDEGLYSRQLYVLGHDAMRRMQVLCRDARFGASRANLGHRPTCLPPGEPDAAFNLRKVPAAQSSSKCAAVASACAGRLAPQRARVEFPPGGTHLARALSLAGQQHPAGGLQRPRH
jgi:hypothetical protein